MAINPKIKERAEKIRKEVYGKDVREALASGLEVMSEDVEETKQRQDNVESQFQAVLDETTEKDVISAPEITAARVGADDINHPNLKERLDTEYQKLSSQLAQNTAQLQAELNLLDSSKIDEVVFDINTFNIKFYAKGSLIKTINISEAGNASAVQSYIDSLVSQGLIEGVTLRDGVVTPQKTTFAKKGKNLFDESHLHHNVIISGDSVFGYRLSEREGGYSVIFPGEKGKTYTIKNAKNTDRFIICVNEGYPQFEELLTRWVITDSSLDSFTVQLEGDEDHIIVYLSSPSQDTVPQFFQIEEGSEQTSYESHHAINILLSVDTLKDIFKKTGKIPAEAFGVSTENEDNKIYLQNAIDYASTLVSGDEKIEVVLPDGTYMVDGTIYLKSNVILSGNGCIKATNNAKFDYVDWGYEGDVVRPNGAKTLLAIVGTLENPIKNAGTNGVTVDLNGDNQIVNEGDSYIGIAVVNAEDCDIVDTNSYNAVYAQINPEEGDIKERGLCLFVALANKIRIIGGNYRESGYDTVRIAGLSKDITVIGIKASKAKRGAIQITPPSSKITLSDCIFDNTEGGTDVSHAFFAHNSTNVVANNLILKADTGYCVAIFSDDNMERSGYARNIKLKNIIMENNNDDVKFISLTQPHTKNIEIQGICLTSKKDAGVSSPIWSVNILNGVHNVDLDLTIPYIKSPPIYIGGCHDIRLKINFETSEAISPPIVFLNNYDEKRCGDITVYDSIFDAPNCETVISGNGQSDNVVIRNSKLTAKKAVNFTEGDMEIDILDSNFKGVSSLGTFSPASGMIRNVKGVSDTVV